MLDTRREQQARLEARERHGCACCDRDAGDGSGVRVDPTRNVDGQHRCAGGRTRVDRLGHRTFGGARQSNAEQCVDDQIRARYLPRDRVETDDASGEARQVQLGQLSVPVGRQNGGRVRTLRCEDPSGHQAVACVVPLPAHDNHPAPVRSAEQPARGARDGPSGVFHQLLD